MTRSLSQDEWGLFLNEAEQYPTLRLAISCSPGVTLPDALGHELSTEVALIPAWDKTLHPQTTCIVSDDPDLAIAGITQLQPDCIVLNISECIASDLLNRINGKLEELDLVFSETEQALLTLLNEGKKVVLTGTFSDELLDGLAPFIRQRANTLDASGQLILVSQKPIVFMDAVFHEATLAEKRAALMERGFNEGDLERLEQEAPSCMATQSFTILSTRLRFQHAHPDKASQRAWDGLSALRPSILISEFNPESSENDAKGYLDARQSAFNQAIQDEPYVFLAGLTGVGKSRFVENELSDRTLFHGEASIHEWGKASPEKKPTLFLDEANLSTRQWSELEGLFNTPPALVIDGKYHILTEHHKVIFAGNPLSYGDERKLAPLFARHGNSIVFEPLSNAFIYEKTLKPILKEQFDPKDYELIGKELLRAYDFLIEVSRDEVLISPRQIQMMALAVIDYHHRFPNADIQEIARFQARHIAYPLVPRQHLERFNQAFPPVDRTAMLKDHEHPKLEFKRFQATPSRDMALWQLTDFLSLRTFQRETDISNSALRLGGLHRFVIEGEPGIGKSQMVIELMAGMGLHKLQLGDAQAPEIKNGFYCLSASMQLSLQEAILLKAFDDGAIVLIDEINSMPTLEKMLNSLLDGKHPKDDNRPPRNPGFRILGTQNPPTMAGRRLASPALENRTQTIRLSPYPEKDMHTILERMGVTSVITRTELIEAFQSKVSEAKVRHLTPAPSFRNFIHMAKQLVEGHSKMEETPRYTNSIANAEETKEPDEAALRYASAARITQAFRDKLAQMTSNESLESDLPNSPKH